jgi:hypothetical protein
MIANRHFCGRPVVPTFQPGKPVNFPTLPTESGAASGDPPMENENVCASRVLEGRLLPRSRAPGCRASHRAPLYAVACRFLMSQTEGSVDETTRE